MTENDIFSENNGTAKKKAIAYVNWQLPRNGKEPIKSRRGFPLFQNEKYPDVKEDMLIELARQNGGTVNLMMQVQVVIPAIPETLEDLDLSSIEIIPVEVK